MAPRASCQTAACTGRRGTWEDDVGLRDRPPGGYPQPVPAETGGHLRAATDLDGTGRLRLPTPVEGRMATTVAAGPPRSSTHARCSWN